MIHLLEYLLLKPFLFTADLLPLPFLEKIAMLGGTISFYVMPNRRKVALDNIDKVFGDTLSQAEKIELAKNAFQHAGLSFIELMVMTNFMKCDISYQL